MVWFIVACAVLVLLAAAIAATGRLGSMPEPVVDDYLPLVPHRHPWPDEVRRVRFGTVLWGYSRAQVDQFLQRVADGMEGRPVYGEVVRDAHGPAPQAWDTAFRAAPGNAHGAARRDLE